MSQEATNPIASGNAAILARRYADALYDLAGEQKQLDAVAGDLRLLNRLQRESAEFRYIAHQPRLTRTQLVKAMQQVAASAGLSKLTSNFLALVAKHRRLNHLGAIIDAFLADLAAHRGEFTAEIRSAQALSSAQAEKLAAKLASWAGGKVHLSVREEPGLLGGLVVKMGSRVIDASVKNRLERLERQLKLDTTTLEGAA
jgi:F-type H+-transporting ATPase subunit delta